MKRYSRKRTLAVAVIGVVALCLSGCAGGQVKGAATAADTFVIAPPFSVVTDLDPATAYSNELMALQNVYESLTRFNTETQRAEPQLATEWKVSEDGLNWTFTLREGVTFHSGRAMDATAVKEALDRNRAAELGSAYIWDSVEEIVATDPLTLEFRLAYPAPIDLIASAVSSTFIYDVAAAGDGDPADWFNAGNDAGTGPYALASWEKGAEVEVKLAAFEDYWGGWDGNHFENVEFRVTPDANTAWQLVQSGEVDYVQSLTPQLFAQARTTPSVQAVEGPSFQNLVVLLNSVSGPTADVEVRKALQLAIDYDGLVSSLDGAGIPSSGIVPEGLLGYTPGLEGKTDLTEAKRLLEAAGYGENGTPLELTMSYTQGNESQAKLATLLISAVDKLGGTLVATPMEWNAQWDKAKGADPESRQHIFVMDWYPEYADASSWFVSLFKSSPEISFNLSYVNDPVLDEQIDALPRLTATDRDAAEKQYELLQQEIVTDRALVAVPYVQAAQRVLSPRVESFVDNTAYPGIVHVYDTRVAQ